MMNQIFKWGVSTFGVAIFYILGLLIFKESHPFSRFNMYSTFPNWSYSFYLTDERNDIIPFDSLNTNGGRAGHLFGSICDKNQIIYGNFKETNEELNIVGKQMTKILLNSTNFKRNKINIYRKGFYIQNDSIKNITELMATYEIH